MMYEAHCHGEVERAELTALDMIEALKIDFARAFEQRALEGKK